MVRKIAWVSRVYGWTEGFAFFVYVGATTARKKPPIQCMAQGFQDKLIKDSVSSVCPREKFVRRTLYLEVCQFSLLLKIADIKDREAN